MKKSKKNDEHLDGKIKRSAVLLRRPCREQERLQDPCLRRIVLAAWNQLKNQPHHFCVQSRHWAVGVSILLLKTPLFKHAKMYVCKETFQSTVTITRMKSCLSKQRHMNSTSNCIMSCSKLRLASFFLAYQMEQKVIHQIRRTQHSAARAWIQYLKNCDELRMKHK